MIHIKLDVVKTFVNGLNSFCRANFLDDDLLCLVAVLLVLLLALLYRGVAAHVLLHLVTNWSKFLPLNFVTNLTGNRFAFFHVVIPLSLLRTAQCL